MADGRPRAGGPTIDAWPGWDLSEGVVHVGVDALDETVDERRVVGLLARIEAEVLQQLRSRGAGRPAGPGQAPSSTSGSVRPWAAEVAGAHDRRAALAQPLDRGGSRRGCGSRR